MTKLVGSFIAKALTLRSLTFAVFLKRTNYNI